MPDNYDNLDELAAPAPAERNEDRIWRHQDNLENEERRSSAHTPSQTPTNGDGEGKESPEYDVPEDFANLDELVAPEPVENPDEQAWYRHESLESERRSGSLAASKRAGISRSRRSQQTRRSGGSNDRDTESRMQERRESTAGADSLQPAQSHTQKNAAYLSRAWIELYTIAYLVFFSIMGTLARLGVEWLTFYPGAPSVFPVLWANFGGSLVLGFLVEDKRLFQHYHGKQSSVSDDSEETITEVSDTAQSKQLLAAKKTIPLYIGLAVGFCGSFTSFSSWMGDEFNSLANNLRTPIDHPTAANHAPSTYSTFSRSAGYSVMAVLAIGLITVALCLAALKIGAHAAILIEPGNIRIPSRIRRFLDIGIIPLGYGCWIGAVLLAIYPPEDSWRQRAVFAIVFAPLGCLLRFYASLKLNGLLASFPVGTFAVNIFGTAVYGMAYDVQHASWGVAGGVIGCQVWQGVLDGFCGALTTVSTFVAELEGLRRRHAYIYGTSSVVGGVGLLVIIMGSMDWTIGFRMPVCLES